MLKLVTIWKCMKWFYIARNEIKMYLTLTTRVSTNDFTLLSTHTIELHARPFNDLGRLIFCTILREAQKQSTIIATLHNFSATFW